MRYNSELEVKNVLGIDSWRNLSKDKFLQFLDLVPQVDKELALQLIGQIPEFTTLARVALDDAAKAYEGLLAANDRGMELDHQVAMERLAILKAELDKDLTPEERLRVLDDIRDVHVRSNLKESENKEFLAEQFEKRLGVGLAIAAAIGAVVFGIAKSGGKQGGDAGGLKAA